MKDARPELEGVEIVERKMCEAGCGGVWYRPIPMNAKCGEKWCPGCRSRIARQLSVAEAESGKVRTLRPGSRARCAESGAGDNRAA